MKKNLLKAMTFVLLLVSLFVLASCSFNAPTVDEAKTNLEAAGYTVTVRDGSEYANSDDCNWPISGSELKYYLYAKKDSDEIHMFYFYSISDADFNKDFINYSGLLSGQINELVYFATKQARKDAQL